MNHKKQTAKKNLLKLKLKKSIDYILTYAHGIDKTGKRNQKIVSNDIIQLKPHYNKLHNPTSLPNNKHISQCLYLYCLCSAVWLFPPPSDIA